MACNFFLLGLFFLAISVDACREQNLTLERCSSGRDCLGFDDPTAPLTCVGRASNASLVVCPSKKAETCVCYPTGPFRYCFEDADCPDEMYCGISPRTGNKLCTGCLTLRDADLNFRPVNKETASSKCGTRSRHHPCGRALDYCSPTMPCSNQYDCVHRAGGKFFSCGADQSPCHCQLTSEDSVKVIECSTNSDCDDPREACAWNIAQNISFCASCDAVGYSPGLLLNNTQKCTNLFKIAPRRPPPRAYVDSSNGRTFDVCINDVQCTGNRKCVEFKDSFETPFSLQPCSSPGNLCFCRPPKLVPCKTGNNCQCGESCATVDITGANQNCVSNALLDTLSTRQYEIIGKPGRIKKGRGLTRDRCRFDWNCKSPRRCTASNDSFGGCAGREACTCEPLIFPQCTSKRDCSKGEVCVTFVDSKLKPFCVSLRSLKQFPYYQLFPPKYSIFRERKIGKNGLTGDSCKFNNDCLPPRSCRHVTELNGVCDGRRACVCKKNGDNKCSNTAKDCPKGEVCVGYKGAFPVNGECISKEAFRNDILPFRRRLGGRQSRTKSPS